MVWGFFVDGIRAQEPVVVGVIPGIPMAAPKSGEGFSDPRKTTAGAPKLVESAVYNLDGTGTTFTEVNQPAYPRVTDEPDSNRLARNDGLVSHVTTQKESARVVGVPEAGGGNWDEPANAYAAKYPYNKVIETESGHVIEMDDSPGAERLHIYHRTGSYAEFRPDGSIVLKSLNDAFELVHKDKHEVTLGTKTDSCKELKLLVTEDLTVQVGGNVSLDVTGNVTGTVAGNVDVTASEVSITGNTSIDGTLDVTGIITAPDVILNNILDVLTHTHVDPQGGVTGPPV